MKRSDIQYDSAVIHFSKMSQGQIDQYASSVAEKIGYSPQMSLVKLVKYLGGCLHWRNLFGDDADTETIFVHGKLDFDIFLSVISSPRRDRFTVAHELGHYFLHSIEGIHPIVANRGGSDIAEHQANWFAAGFLMPADLMLRKMEDNLSIERMAEDFSVSVKAVQVRMIQVRMNSI